MKKQLTQSQKGSALVESALVMPVILLLLFGLLEFGQILRIQQALTNAAREGARVGAIHLDSSQALDSASAVTQDYLERTGVNLTNVKVSPAFSELNGIQALQLKIDYDYVSHLSGWVPGLDTIGLRSRVVMRREA